MSFLCDYFSGFPHIVKSYQFLAVEGDSSMKVRILPEMIASDGSRAGQRTSCPGTRSGRLDRGRRETKDATCALPSFSLFRLM